MSSSVSVDVHPKDLADALWNAVNLGKEDGDWEGCPHVMLVVQPSEATGMGLMAVYGAGRTTAGRTVIELESGAPEGSFSVLLDREDARTIQTQLRGMGVAKATRVAVTIDMAGREAVDFDEDGNPDVRFVNLTIAKDEEPLAELADTDPENKWAWVWEMVDDGLDLPPIDHGLQRPTALDVRVIKKVADLKGTGTQVIDLGFSHRKNVLTWSMGPRVRGIVAEIVREKADPANLMVSP